MGRTAAMGMPLPTKSLSAKSLPTKPGSVFEDDLSQDTSGYQRDGDDGSQALDATKPDDAAHSLKKKAREEHITGNTRAVQIMVVVPAQVSTEMVVGMCCHGH